MRITDSSEEFWECNQTKHFRNFDKRIQWKTRRIHADVEGVDNIWIDEWRSPQGDQESSGIVFIYACDCCKIWEGLQGNRFFTTNTTLEKLQ